MLGARRMPVISYAIEVIACRGPGQDRAAVIPVDDGVVVALADGAGGTGNGAAAAEAVIDAVTRVSASGTWSALLDDLDPHVERLGQTTAVVLRVTGREIVGASVGDSGAWVIRGAQIEDLTAAQVRKPLVGAGCRPVSFRAAALGAGTLLVASDGLLRYARADDIARVVARADLAAAARGLIELVRL